jgi:DNA-binding NarL/FixJ family response regulator
MTVLVCAARSLCTDALSAYLVSHGRPVDYVEPEPSAVRAAVRSPGVTHLLLLDAPAVDEEWTVTFTEVRLNGSVRIVVLEGDAAIDPDSLPALLVHQVLPRGCGLSELVEAIQVGDGQGFPSARRRPSDRPRTCASVGRHAPTKARWSAAEVLSRREREIADLMADGWSTEQIAARLDVSKNTVHTHVQSILRKLGARNRVEAVNRYLFARHHLDLSMAS